MQNKTKKRTALLHTTKDFALAFVIVLIINATIGFHARVPTGSMLPTIEIGDHLFVNRIPLYFSQPQRGDIVVFNMSNKKFVKRVIGLPGETISIENGKVLINNAPLEEPYLQKNTETSQGPIEFPITLPEDCFLVMGDNRTNSYDGRFFGPIERKDIVGTGSFRLFPFNKIGKVK